MKNEKNEKSNKNGNDSWKFNSCLICDALYDDKRKKFLTKIKNSKKCMENAQTKWELLKYEIRKFITDYSKISKLGLNGLQPQTF